MEKKMTLSLPNDTPEIRQKAKEIKLRLLARCEDATLSDDYCMQLAFWEIYSNLILEYNSTQ